MTPPPAIATPPGMTLTGAMQPGFERILTPEALALVADLVRRFAPRVDELLGARHARQRRIDSGEERFDFLPGTRAIRESDWTVGPLPADLRDRRVEITGPVER